MKECFVKQGFIILLGTFIFASHVASGMENQPKATLNEASSRALNDLFCQDPANLAPVNDEETAREAQRLIDNGADLNWVHDEYTLRFLSEAARQQRPRMCKVLLDNGADVFYIKPRHHRLPLFWAAACSQHCAHLIMEKMLATPVPGQSDRMRAFMLCLTRMPEAGALRSVFPPVLQVLMKNEREDRAYEALLTLEEHEFNSEKPFLTHVKDVLRSTHFPRRAIEDAKTGFMKLAGRGKVDHCELLIFNNSTSVLHATPSGITALHEAARWGREDVCNLLIAHGANVFALQRGGLTPLRCAINASDGIGEFAWPRDSEIKVSYLLICNSLMQIMIALNREAALADLRNCPDCPTKAQLLLKYFSDVVAEQNKQEQQ